MKQASICVFVLLLTAGLAWAEEAPAPDAAPPADEAAPAAPLFEGGGCEMPDLTGLSEQEAETALREAGFEVSSAVETATPVCPTRFDCSSIFNCGIGPLCAVTDIGPCCTTGGLGLCCIQGTIKVRTCPCTCTGNPCNIQCPNSSDVKWRCS